jgi:hypothetical protein
VGTEMDAMERAFCYLLNPDRSAPTPIARLSVWSNAQEELLLFFCLAGRARMHAVSFLVMVCSRKENLKNHFAGQKYTLQPKLLYIYTYMVWYACMHIYIQSRSFSFFL